MYAIRSYYAPGLHEKAALVTEHLRLDDFHLGNGSINNLHNVPICNGSFLPAPAAGRLRSHSSPAAGPAP